MKTPRLNVPIVLVHGLLGFGELRVGNRQVACYFPGIPEHFRAAGNRVFLARVSPTGSIAQRAAQLKDYLNQVSPHEPVHIIAHSMGGLDARYLISRLGMAKRVLTLTTLGTPHHGSAFADWSIHRLEGMFRPLLEFIGLPSEAFYELTTERCRLFNCEVPDAPNVRYFSVAGQISLSWPAPEWQLSQRIVAAAEGPNDGVVSIASATYGELCDIWEGDHVSLVNQKSLSARAFGRWHDRIPQYTALLHRLADAGF